MEDNYDRAERLAAIGRRLLADRGDEQAWHELADVIDEQHGAGDRKVMQAREDR